MKYSIIAGLGAILVLGSCGKKTEEARPIRKDLTETVFAAGILEARNTYQLTAQADGYLLAVNFEEGDTVMAGKLLAVTDNKESRFNQESARDLYQIAQSNTQSNAPALQQAAQTIEVNKKKMELDKIQYQRYKTLWESNSIARVEFEKAELQFKTSAGNYESSLEYYRQLKQQAEQQAISNKASTNINNVILNRNQIKAVVGGKIYKKYKQAGDYVRRGESIALIGEARDIYAKVNIDESNIGKIKLGQEALIQLNTNKDKTYKGFVAEIYPAFDESTQSFICKIKFAEPLDFKIINTQLQSNIIVENNRNALLIPRKYLDFGGRVQVKGKNEKTKVVTKFVSSEWVQVLSGIDENMVLITEKTSGKKTSSSEDGLQIQ